MRRARKVDANQREIVAALRAAGCSVEVLSDVGRGVPDLLVGYDRRNILMEVKVPDEALNQLQFEWHGYWRGQVTTVATVDEALDYVFPLSSLLPKYDINQPYLGAKARRA